MSYRHLLDEIKKDLPSPGYLFVSSDPFLQTEAISLVKSLVPQEEMDFNFQPFDLQTAKESQLSVEHIIDVLNTVPFFSGRKFVVIENFQKILKKDLKKLANYLLKPNPSSVLILINSGAVKKETRDELSGLKQIILDITEKEVPDWLKARARKKGIELTEDAIDYLIGTVGPELGLLSSEVDKCTSIGKGRIEKEDIMNVVEGRRNYNAFALTDAIRAGDADRIFSIYRILRDSEEPYSLLGALNWQYARAFSEKNTPREARYYSEVFKVLNKADVGIKTLGGVYPLELLLVKLLRLSKQR